MTAVLGANGAGKTTLAQVAARLLVPDRGAVEADGRCGYVSQNPAHHALRETVTDEVAYGLRNLDVPNPDGPSVSQPSWSGSGLSELAGRHPRDLSSGERQRLAIASVTVMRPVAMILDEPTRGMDGLRKLALAEMVRALARDGCAVGLVTHDVDFAAEASHRVTTVARGRVLADAVPVAVLAHGGYFACQVGLALGCTTVAEAARMLRGEAGRVHV